MSTEELMTVKPTKGIEVLNEATALFDVLNKFNMVEDESKPGSYYFERIIDESKSVRVEVSKDDELTVNKD